MLAEVPGYEVVVAGSLGPYLCSLVSELLRCEVVEQSDEQTLVVVEGEDAAAAMRLVGRLLDRGLHVEQLRELRS